MVSQKPQVDEFTDFVREHETRLRRALIAAFGGDVGRDAACEALAYGWEHWGRIQDMANPTGYLYTVGRNYAGRAKRRRDPIIWSQNHSGIPEVEPRLLVALGELSERQRTVVVLVHCFDWTLSEVANVLGLSKSSVQNHAERGMKSLRRSIGVSV